jgi:HSP20 family protein
MTHTKLKNQRKEVMLIRFALPTELESLHESLALPATQGLVPVDIMEDEKGTTVFAEIPGVKKEDMSLTFEDEVLTIVGKRQVREIPNDARILLHEQRRRDVSRSIHIGHPVEAAQITASLENGLLTVQLPKAEAARPRTIAIS